MEQNDENQTSSNFVFSFNPIEKIKSISDDLNRKIKEMQNNPNKLIIVSDFDHTLTKKFQNDHKTVLHSSYGLPQASKVISENYEKGVIDLYKSYGKYEYDPTIDDNTKDYYMKQWYIESLELYLKESISKEDFRIMILEAVGKFYFRNGIKELFDLVKLHQIPFFVLSGGIKEVIEESFKILLGNEYEELKEKKLVNIIANEFTYDLKSGKIERYIEPLIYTMNKEKHLKATVGQVINFDNPNIILLGDHINDADMINSIQCSEFVKIGFANLFEDDLTEEQKKLLGQYENRYDVLVLNDGNMTYVNKLIKQIKTEVQE